MHTSLDSMRIIHWASGAPMSSELPISDPHPDPGLLGPDSLTWRLHEEQWLITAGARAFLMQAAHPKVAQGALDHSGFAEDPFGRVSRTIQGMAVLIFGTTHEANAMARHINRLHDTVQGTLPESIGRYKAGETYSAMEPLALLWVHIVFVDSLLTAYKTFVGTLSEAACEQYWQESCRYARLLGLTDKTLPASYDAVQRYMRDALASGEIAIGPAAQFIAQKVLYPPMPLLRKPLWMMVRLITVGHRVCELSWHPQGVPGRTCKNSFSSIIHRPCCRTTSIRHTTGIRTALGHEAEGRISYGTWRRSSLTPSLSQCTR